MKQVSIIIDGEIYDIQDLGPQVLDSAHPRIEICYHFCDLFKQCSRFLYDAAVPCLLACERQDEGNGFYFQKRMIKENNV